MKRTGQRYASLDRIDVNDDDDDDEALLKLSFVNLEGESDKSEDNNTKYLRNIVKQRKQEEQMKRSTHKGAPEARRPSWGLSSSDDEAASVDGSNKVSKLQPQLIHTQAVGTSFKPTNLYVALLHGALGVGRRQNGPRYVMKCN